LRLPQPHRSGNAAAIASPIHRLGLLRKCPGMMCVMAARRLPRTAHKALANPKLEKYPALKEGLKKRLRQLQALQAQR
jgi:hypothetical protein